MNLLNYLTIDVEDFFQVSAFESIVSKESWTKYPSRVEQNTQNILNILDKHNIKATFFVLGWIAEKHPKIVKKIDNLGHQIGCHSYYHRLVYNLTPEEFREDTKKAKDRLEQIIGKKVEGYRAPSYSITRKSLWAIPILKDLGFTYDSSVFPIHHDRYGIPNAPRYPFIWKTSGNDPEIMTPCDGEEHNRENHCFIEYPISTALFFGKNLPVSGGGYFRLFPYWFTKMTLKRINEKEKKSFVFYLHPWEFDPEQPRLEKATLLSKFRHYNNLNKTGIRFERLIQDFSFGPMHSE